jgi:protein-L-isoaspartate(D-aspartate) O-methyltransferase
VPSNQDLIRTLVATGINDPAVLAAFRAVLREHFVPAEWRERAYEDLPLPIPHGQVTTQPSLIARMIEGLALRGREKVLEVGTGYGFQTALLAILAAEVWSVERWADLAATARENLHRQGIDNAHVVVGDGTEGLRGRDPFDAIVIAAAAPAVPAPLIAQLASGRHLVQPIGRGGREQVTLFVKDGGRLVASRVLTNAHFVPLIGAHGFRSPPSAGALATPPT